MIKEEIVYSIYKLSKERIVKNSDNIDIKMSTQDIAETLAYNISKTFKSNDRFDIKINGNTISCLIKMNRIPEWKKMVINEMELDDERAESINNSTSSFLIFKIINDDIYALTCGYSSSRIKKYIVNNYGRDLIPKLAEARSGIIKSITEQNITGRNLSSQRAFKGISDFNTEKNSKAIPKNFELLVGKDLLEIIGIEPDDKGKIKIGISAGDSIRIHKRMSRKELNILLEVFNKIEKSIDKFNLGYLVEIKGSDTKKTELDNALLDGILKDYSFAEIQPGDSIIDALKYGRKFIVEYNSRDGIIELIDKDSMVILKEVIEKAIKELKKSKVSKTFIKEVITKSTLKIIDEDMFSRFEDSIYNLLRANVEVEEKSYYLLGGTWCMYDLNKYESLKIEFENLYEKNEERINKTDALRSLSIVNTDYSSEDEYNRSFNNNNQVLVMHPNTYKYIEFADLIYWDEKHLYLMCNKGDLSGSSVRDLCGQIEVSSELLRGILDNEKKELDSIYNVLDSNEKNKISIEEFKQLFDKRIVYVAGFKNNYKKNTKSVHCQNLLKSTGDTLRELDMDYLIVNYSR